MDQRNRYTFTTAVNDFRRARNQAILKEIIARFTGESIDLLSYEDVRQKLRAQGSSDIGLQDIPLDAIVGSVGRYADFTRDFLPRYDEDRDRWAGVQSAAVGLAGLPPIEVYKIGEVYFVKDGNHRVSVARRLGADYIHAYVTEVRTRVPLEPDVRPDDLIIKSEYAQFLEQTRLDESHPEADFTITAAGNYPILQEHIDVHRHYLGLDQQREIPYPEAAAHWYEHVYKPIINLIQAQGILRYFPNRTEADLYLWITKHHAKLEVEWGWGVKTETAALDLTKQFGESGRGLISQIGGSILDTVQLEALESGPQPGQWRQENIAIHQGQRLFADLLAPVSGESEGWFAVEQAAFIAEREGAQLHGLHIYAEEAQPGKPTLAEIEAEFHRRCNHLGMTGHFVSRQGEVAEQIIEQARLTDLVVINQNYPPPPSPISKLGSGLHGLLQRCPRPILVVPRTATRLSKALLAYNGSPKANEALYIAAYLASKWDIELVVMTVFDESKKTPPETLLKAKVYLDEHKIEASYTAEQGTKANTILESANEHKCDFILMGSYGLNPVFELFVNSTVDELLRQTQLPVLLAR